MRIFCNILLVLAAQEPAKPPVRLPGSYSHPFFAFKIYLPSGWARGPNHGQANASFYAPKIEPYVPRVDLYLKKTPVEFAAYVQAFKAMLEKTYPDAAFSGEDVVASDQRHSWRFVASFTDGGIPMKSMWRLVGVGDRRYTLGWACPSASYDRYADAIDALMRSFRTYREPKASIEARRSFERLYEEAERLYRQGRNAEALSKFRTCAELIPEYPEIHAAVGTACLKIGNVADAEAAFKKAFELDPSDYGVCYNYGTALLRQSKYDGAIDLLNQATQADPHQEPAWTNLGVAYLGRERPANAATALEKAIAADPESPTAHYNLGLAYERLERQKEAVAQYRETLKLDAAHEGARDGLKRLQ
ncbi:MAG: tetratricopeptide repeat protein [Planctomycetes bacterium]|nr:tetratricopeptide repeat protein [Planctomycetota bacterium]